MSHVASYQFTDSYAASVNSGDNILHLYKGELMRNFVRVFVLGNEICMCIHVIDKNYGKNYISSRR